MAKNDGLRQRAEAIFRENAAQSPEQLKAMSLETMRLMLHELGVHQIELEMQNEELRLAQVELGTAKKHYFDLYDLAPVGYCTLSEQGQILHTNLAAATLLGVTRGKLSKSITCFILKEDQDIYYLYRKQLFETGESQSCELRMVKKDGTQFWAHLEATVAQDDDGAPVLRAVLSDVTERKLAEEALRASEARFKIMFNEAPLGIAMIDSLTGNINSANPMFAKIAGRTVEEMMHIDWMSMTHSDDIQQDLDNMALLNAKKISGFQMEKRYLHPDGTPVWINMTIAPVYIDDTAHPRHLCMIEDISERKRAERSLHKLSQAVEQSQNIIIITDMNANIEYVNKAFVKTTGYSIAEAIGQNPRILQSGKTADATYAEMWANLIRGEVWKGELINRRKDGTEYIESVRISPVRQADGQVINYLAIKEDITERKQIENDLEASRAQLRGYLARREMVSEEERKYIAREIHDELGQILTGLQLNVSVITQKFAADSPLLLKYLHETMLLTNRALDAVRNVASALRPAALDLGIVSALEWLAGRFGSNTGIQSEVHVDETEIPLDENHAIALYRIVQESLTNVARHASASKVTITLVKEGDDYVLKVRDNGAGFDSHVKKANSYGLVGIRERALMLAGTVYINTQPGSGTEIVVRIPINNNSRKL